MKNSNHGSGGGGGGGGAQPAGDWIANMPYDSQFVHLANNCGDSIQMASGPRVTQDASWAGMNGNSSTEVSRNFDGPTYIWLDSGASINAGTDVRVVEVDASCRRLIPHR